MANYNDLASVASLSNIDPEFATAFYKAPPPGISLSAETVPMARKGVGMMEKQRNSLMGPTEVDQETRLIRMRDGFESEIRIVRPQKKDKHGPLIVMIYGGGFAMGSNMSMLPYGQAAATLLNAVVVCVSYRLAPEHAFPTQFNDAYDSLSWAAENAVALGADTDKGFIIGGESAGGNLTAVAAFEAIQAKLSPAVTGVWLSAPLLMVDSIVPADYRELWISRQQNYSAPGIGTPFINDSCLPLYKPNVNSTTFSPVNGHDHLDSFPKTFIQVCGLDPLRDDGLVFERMLKASGVQTRLEAYPGVPHCVWASNPKLQASRKSIVDALEGIGWLLGQEVSREDVKKVLGPLANAS